MPIFILTPKKDKMNAPFWITSTRPSDTAVIVSALREMDARSYVSKIFRSDKDYNLNAPGKTPTPVSETPWDRLDYVDCEEVTSNPDYQKYLANAGTGEDPKILKQ